MTEISHAQDRNLSLDLLRVLAIVLVMWQHASECYYIGPGVTVVEDAVPTVGVFNSYSRACIGLFVMISGYLLLPMRQSAGQFFRRRFSRVLFPWLFWCVAFAVYMALRNHGGWAETLDNVAHIPVNFGTDVGHLWYVYMLLGVYLLVPILSPWLRTCGKRELQLYLVLWGVTLLLPYLHHVWPQLWGECSWNPTPTLYYFTGFGGYFVLGHYLRRYGPLSQWLSWLLLLGGYAVTALVFILHASSTRSAVDAEMPWDFCCLNVAMMVLGTFSLVIRLRVKASRVVRKLVVSASLCSYGVYLCHIMILNEMHPVADHLLRSLPARIAFTAISTFLLSWLAVWLLAKLPKAKWWMGV